MWTRYDVNFYIFMNLYFYIAIGNSAETPKFDSYVSKIFNRKGI